MQHFQPSQEQIAGRVGGTLSTFRFVVLAPNLPYRLGKEQMNAEMQHEDLRGCLEIDWG